MREFNKQAEFLKDNITGNTKTMRDRIITSISFLSFAIAKETTKSRLRLKKNKTSRIEGVKVMTVRR